MADSAGHLVWLVEIVSVTAVTTKYLENNYAGLLDRGLFSECIHNSMDFKRFMDVSFPRESPLMNVVETI